jgi:hypothetical protein
MNYFESSFFPFPQALHPNESKQRSFGKAVDLLQLDLAQQAELTTRVANSNGIVRIFVHPYYRVQQSIRNHSPRNNAYVKSMITRDKKNLNIFEKCIASTNLDTPPVIVLEGQSWIDNTKERLDQFAGHNYYTLTTIDSDPELINHQIKLGYPPQSHTQIYNILEQVGVKKVIIGGHNLVIDNGYYVPELDLYENQLYLNGKEYSTYIPMYGCAGTTIWGFVESEKFDVMLSNCSHPDGIKKLKTILTEQTGTQL